MFCQTSLYVSSSSVFSFYAIFCNSFTDIFDRIYNRLKLAGSKKYFQ